MELGYRSGVFQWQWLRRNWDMQTRGLRFPSLLMFFQGAEESRRQVGTLIVPKSAQNWCNWGRAGTDVMQ